MRAAPLVRAIDRFAAGVRAGLRTCFPTGFRRCDNQRALGGSADSEGHRNPRTGGADIGVYGDSVFGDGLDPQ